MVARKKDCYSYPGCSPAETNRLLNIHSFLANGPRTTPEIVAHCDRNYCDVVESLNYAFRRGTLKKKSQRGYKGRGKRPKIWWNSPDVEKLQLQVPEESPLSQLSAEKRESLLAMDRAKCGANPVTKKPVTDHELYYLAELCAAIELNPGVLLTDLAPIVKVDFSTVRNRKKLGAYLGVIEAQRIMDGTPGKPHALKNVWSRVKELASTRRVAPARNKQLLIHRTPKKNRCNDEQRKWLAALTAKDCNLSEFDFQVMTRVLLPSIGSERITTYRRLADELGCGLNAIEKPTLRLKAKGWIEVKKNAGGEAGRESAFRPTWDLVELIYQKKLKSQGQLKLSRNGVHKKASTRSAKKSAARLKPQWDEQRGELSLGESKCEFAIQAKRIREALAAFQGSNWPDKIDTVCKNNPQAHHDVIRGLNKCTFLKFSSASSGTSIAWEYAKS